jgi:hypothetical protein
MFLEFYYILTFCGVYIKTAPGWVYASLQSIAMEWLGFALLIPLFISILRMIVKKYPILM